MCKEVFELYSVLGENRVLFPIYKTLLSTIKHLNLDVQYSFKTIGFLNHESLF